MNLIEKLEREITQQTRNGREDIYVDVNDLKELGYKIEKNRQGRMYVDLSTLRLYMNKFKFKDSLKVETKPQTIKHLENRKEQIEKQTPDMSWDSVSK